jgi:hypothetical protein
MPMDVVRAGKYGVVLEASWDSSRGGQGGAEIHLRLLYQCRAGAGPVLELFAKMLSGGQTLANPELAFS